MHHQQSLLKHGHSFLGRSSDIVTSILALNGSQYVDYAVMLLPSPSITKDAKPNVVNAVLMLI